MAGLTIPTTFTAVDKFTAVVSKMTNATTVFTQKAAVGFARVERAERSLRNGIEKSLGVLGQFGLALSFLAVGQTIVASQFEAEKSLASLSAITGVTGKEFNAFEKQVAAVSKTQKMFVADTAKAFEIIGSAKPELLANASALGMVTDAAILLSKATGDELAVSAANLTATLNQFNLGANDANRIINALAAGSQAGAAAVPLISQAMDKFGTAANAMNISVEQSVALIETLAEKNIMGAEAGTALRNVLLKMSTAGALPKEALTQLQKFGVNTKILMNNALPLNERLKEFSKIAGDATALSKVFGTENLIAGQILLNNVGTVEKYTKAVTGTNTAQIQAGINSNTLSNRYTELIASFKNATVSTDSNNKAVNLAKDAMFFLAENMNTVVGIGASLIGLFIAYKAIVFIASVYTGLYNGAIALTTFLKKNAIATYIIENGIIALQIIAITAATVAQWAFAAAVSAGLWPVLAIIAAIALVITIFANFGAIVSDIKERWAKMINLFKSGDILGAFMVIGQSILKFILYPIELILKLISKIPGVIGTTAGAALEKLNNVTGTVNVENAPAGEGKGMLLNPEATTERIRTERSIRTEEKRSILEIFTNGTEATLSGNNSNIKLSPTLGF